MELKYYLIALAFISVLVAFLRNRNKDESKSIEEKKALIKKAVKMLEDFKNSPDSDYLISNSI